MTPRNCGLPSTMTQALGESGSFAVGEGDRARRGSARDRAPAGRWTRMSALAAVLSSILAILILPLSLAATMESISAAGGGAERDFGDAEQAFLLGTRNAGADAHLAAAQAVACSRWRP